MDPTHGMCQNYQAVQLVLICFDRKRIVIKPSLIPHNSRFGTYWNTSCCLPSQCFKRFEALHRPFHPIRAAILFSPTRMWGKEIVMVALTGWGQDEDRQKSNDAGFDQHLVKPVDSKALTKLLSEAIT